MPKIIDHDERRDEFAEAVCRLIVRGGAANVTTRQIAAEAGYSTGILAHYFKDKSEVMRYSLVYSHRQIWAFMGDDELQGLEGLCTFMRACLPLDERRVFLAQVEASYFGLAVGDTELSAALEKEFNAFNQIVGDFIAAAVDAGELRPSANDGELVSLLRLVMDGISFRVAVGRVLSVDSQLRLLDSVIALYRAG